MNAIKRNLLLFSSSLLVGSAVAQQPTVGDHQDVVYQNNGNIYVQKQLPLYLKFSTTPDGKNFDLKSKSTPEYTDPMYLDTEGVNYIRSKWAVDPNTKKTVQPPREVMYEIYADGIAPVSSSSFSGAPKYRANGNIYYGKGLKVDISSKDGVSGVASIHKALDAGSWSDYSGTISVDNEGTHNLYYYAHDNVGNEEKARSRKFIVDITAPTSSDAIVGIVHNSNIIAPSTKFKLTSTDNLSGTRRTYFAYDERSQNTYPGYPVSVAYLSDGNHTLYYYTVDNVKNEESRKSFSFYLDKIAPEITVKIEGDQHETAGNFFISPNTRINMTATDNKAGVEGIYYNINRQGKTKFGSPFAIPERGGVHNIIYWAVDNVENQRAARSVASAVGNKKIFMDNRAPTTGISYGKPQFFDRDTLFINMDTKIYLKSRDYESGVAKIEYKVDGGSSNTYSSAFNVTASGNHTVSFNATDNVNNAEQSKESKFFVDNDPPVIHHNFSIEPIGTKKKGGKTVNIYPNYTRLYLGATDKDCGTHRITYSLNGAEARDYSSPYTLDVSEVRRFRKNTFHEVEVKAYDKLGNVSTEMITFFVGE